MAVTRADIITLTLAKIDEIDPFGSDQLLPSEDLIERLMDKSADTMLRNAPLWMIQGSVIDTTGGNHVYTPDKGTGIVVLPSDFLRLHSFKLEEWNKVVSEAISEQHPKYNLQKNIYTRGKANKPVVVLRYDTVKKFVLEYYSSTELSTPTIEVANYVKSVTAENVDTSLIDLLTWYIAYDVCVSMHDTERINLIKSKIAEITQSITL